MEMNSTQHWTEKNKEKFQLAIALDFVDQLEAKMDSSPPIKQSELAQKLGVTEGRVSQILNNPGNLTLNMMVKCARALGLKVAVVAYDDGDSQNTRGPIHAEVFRSCWELVSKPRDMWSLSSVNSTTLTTAATIVGGSTHLAGGNGYVAGGASLYSCSSASGFIKYYGNGFDNGWRVQFYPHPSSAENRAALLPQKVQPHSNDERAALGH